MTVPEFIAKWSRVELKERSAAQEHFIDLCAVFEHPTPAAADPTGETFCFERGAAKQGPSTRAGHEARGFADAWKRGFFGWEYKGKHKDLAAAYDQLLRYRDALENPPLLVVCDLDRMVVHTNFTGTVSAAYDIPLARLAEARNIEILRAVFHNPEALRPGRTSAAVTQEAAQHLADIAAAMRQRGLDPAAVAHFLDRIVFCLFAEDIGLLPDMVFSRLVNKSGGDPARFRKMLGELFDSMAAGGDFGLESIRRFNGNLFDDPPSPGGLGGASRTVLDLAAADVKRIAAAAELDWSAVDPSIFGTLFERGLDPAKRAQLGAHFTSREDIELVVDAVVMAPLRREWAETKAVAERLLATGKKTPGSAGVPPASFSKQPREWHSRGYLPHFDHPGLVQTITFHLADSLPAPMVERLLARTKTADDPALRQDVEDALDASQGACHLRDPRVAACVQNALLHFDGDRYRLLAWVVMPNHVHVLIETRPGFRLDDIVHAWKSFTAHECNRLLKRAGAFWQKDYCDRFIRDGAHYRKAKAYIEQNPVKAGLVATAAEWRVGSAGGAGSAGSAAVPAASQERAGGTPALPGGALSGAQLRKARGEAESLLHQFLDRLRRVTILDPACGSGNFLYVALLKLKDLEKEVAVNFPSAHGLNTFLPGVGPWQLYGLEINPYAHDLAQMTVWIGWLQWIRVNGFGFPADPILKPLADNIRRMDAILPPGSAGVPPASSEEATGPAAPPAEPEWPRVDFIVGNPPFLGGKMLRRELGDEYVDRMHAFWKGRVPAEADLCCYWFEKARAHIAAGLCKRAGLLATQGIRGGANRDVLKRIKESGDIFWAESDRPWILDGANVHVSMVGFDAKLESARILDGKPVGTINPNLTAETDVTQARIIAANKGIAFMGDTKVGPFEIPERVARQWLGARNPHGKPNADVVRPWANGLELTRAPQGLWIVDFPPGMSETEAAHYEAPFEYIKEKVKPVRAVARSGDRTGVSWWIHQRPRPDMRAALVGLPRYIATPCVSKHRIFVWLQSEILPDHALIVFARSDDYFFGVLHSRPHEVWALTLGTRLETRPRYTPTTCFETFPMPASAPDQEKTIADAARRLDDARRTWVGDRTDKTRTLTALYNKKPTWLVDAHRELDAAVAAAYGWPADLTDAAVLERLLALNQARAKAGTPAAAG